MTYAQFGLIEASDYNNIVGGNPTDVAGTFNRVWGVGQNDRGWGQTAVSQVSALSQVTAPQWATLINNLNNAYRHTISTGGTGLSAPVTGDTIYFISTLTGYVTDVYNSRLNTTSTGSTTSGSYSFGLVASSGGVGDFTATRNIAFASIDQFRYFWNAGGRVTFDVTSVTNNDGTGRSGSMVTLANTNFNAKTVLARSCLARTGTGGVVVTDVTASGFYTLPNDIVGPILPTTYCEITGNTYPYTGDYVKLTASVTGGGSGSYGGNGTTLRLYFRTYSSTTGSSFVNDSLNVTINYTVTVTYPQTSYLSNSWGTATIS